MHKRIIICGGNGSGKSTLGYALSQRTGMPFFDIEDYYFPDKTKEYIYDVGRSREQVKKLLYHDIRKCDSFILAAVKPDFDEKVNSFYTSAIYINVPKPIRMKRVRNRSYQKYGDKILPGGELHEKEESFFRMVQERSNIIIEKWLDTLHIPVIEIDGTKPIGESVEILVKQLNII